MKKRTFFTFICFIIGFLSISAQIPEGYYNAAYGKKGKELQQILSQIISDDVFIVDYGSTTAARALDFVDGYLYDVYSHPCCHITEQGIGTSEQCKIYSFEHIFCQSWFNPVLDDGAALFNCSSSEPFPPCSDLHHIFPTDHYVNSSYHGDSPFGEVAMPRKISQNGSIWGYANYNCSDTSLHKKPVFEPVDEFKGDIARALLYISIRYMNMDETFGSSQMTEKSQFKPWALDMLKKWHAMDPVSEKERSRNDLIFNIFQFNRNPLIDHPELVGLIWGSDSLYSTFKSINNDGRPDIIDTDTNEFEVVLTFDMDLDSASAVKTENYSFTNGICVESVSYNQKKVTLTLGSPLVKGTIYYIYVKDIKSIDGKYVRERSVGFLYGPYGSRYIFCAPPREVIATWTFDHLALDSTYTIPANTDLGDPAIFTNAKIYANGTRGSSVFLSNEIGVAGSGNLSGDPRSSAMAGKALAIKRRDANGKSMVVMFPTKGWKEILMTFANTRSATGFETHKWEWSLDGENYDSLAVGNTMADYGQVLAKDFYMMRELDLRKITAINNQDSVFLRITVDDASGATGSNTFDNFVVYGEPLNWEPPVGIKTNVDNSAVAIYPNPNNGYFTLQADSKIYRDVQVFDMTGKKLIEQKIMDNETHLNISTFPNGIYFVKLIGESSKDNIVKKVIIAK